ncbi:response regulator transcription factor [Phaeobacter sp. HF9A]|uniref:response regulator transcription factor n=1 Tax=Phaeobacter sp. HF9A TaxID=2721561 RepID=UPI0014311FAA|nr:response regulator transcription factor [Phaeobacter sp. HF9A]NIZ11895.1 response regulator transcription factor [Phaeobacter sp. HF9A]
MAPAANLPQSAIRVAAVDDHKLFLAGLDRLLNGPDGTMHCQCFESGLDLLEALEAGKRFDVIVTDLTMRDLNGLALITAVRSRGMTAHCIILTASEDGLTRESSERLGAFRFLHKSADPETLLDAIREAHAAKRPSPRDMSLRLAESDASIVPQLGPKQTRVLELIAEGHSNRQISDALFISENTVKTHLQAIYRELGVKSRTAAARRARELSLI